MYVLLHHDLFVLTIVEFEIKNKYSLIIVCLNNKKYMNDLIENIYTFNLQTNKSNSSDEYYYYIIFLFHYSISSYHNHRHLATVRKCTHEKQI
jgi:hypothetical protein